MNDLVDFKDFEEVSNIHVDTTEEKKILLLTNQARSSGVSKWKVISLLKSKFPHEKVKKIAEMIYHQEITIGGTTHHLSKEVLPTLTGKRLYLLVACLLILLFLLFYIGTASNLKHASTRLLNLSSPQYKLSSTISNETTVKSKPSNPSTNKGSETLKSEQVVKSEPSVFESIMDEVE